MCPAGSLPPLPLDEHLAWEVEAVLAWHDEDAKAAIATLLADCADLRRRLALAESGSAKPVRRSGRFRESELWFSGAGKRN